MGHRWNKHLTKVTIVCVPIVAAGVILNAIFDWLVVGVILWAAWEFLHRKFQKRIGIFKWAIQDLPEAEPIIDHIWLFRMCPGVSMPETYSYGINLSQPRSLGTVRVWRREPTTMRRRSTSTHRNAFPNNWFRSVEERQTYIEDDVQDQETYQEPSRQDGRLREELGNHITNPEEYRWDDDGGEVRSHKLRPVGSDIWNNFYVIAD